MSKELVEKILNSYVEEVGTGAGKMLRAWTPAENELAEYAAKLQAENARLIAENKRLMGELREERGYISFDYD